MGKKDFSSGFVALIGKPNVGKSTLLNAIVGQKVAITSPSPQTTRRRVLGVKHGDNYQIVFVDTPGFHKAEHKLGEWMLESAKTEGREADVVVWVVEGTHMPSDEDAKVAKYLQEIPGSKLLVINKVDLVEPKEALLPRLEAYCKLGTFDEVFPVSALAKENLDALIADLITRLPEETPYFPVEQVSDQNNQTMAEEIIREKVLHCTHQEVPHSTAVMIEECRPGSKPDLQYIRAVIFVEREGQKKILLGRGGEKLKQIGQAARQELEPLFGKRIYLDLWIKVKEDWRERSDWLRVLGYE